MQIMIGNGAIILNNRRVLDGQYHVVQGAGDGQPRAWSGYIEVSGQGREGLTEMFRWFDAHPAGLLFTAENGGTLPVTQLKREQFDLDAGQARFTIVFAPAKKE
jgi:hypothetical protein